jgi:hypothetical protein
MIHAENERFYAGPLRGVACALTLQGCRAIIMFGMLIEVFCLDPVAGLGTFAREQDILLIAPFDAFGCGIRCSSDD